MRIRVIVFLAAVLLLACWSAVAQLRLKSQSPDESARETYEERFSLPNALTSTRQIDGALKSLTALTKLAKPKLTGKQMQQVGNTDWETQNLGFVNWVGVVEGTLRKQNYQIAKLQLDIAQMQARSGKLSAKALRTRQNACSKAQQDFQRFWDKFGVAD